MRSNLLFQKISILKDIKGKRKALKFLSKASENNMVMSKLVESYKIDRQKPKLISHVDLLSGYRKYQNDW